MIAGHAIARVSCNERSEFDISVRRWPFAQRSIDVLPLPAEIYIPGRPVDRLWPQFVDFKCLCKAFRADPIDAAELKSRSHALLERRAHEYRRPVILVQSFESGCEKPARPVFVPQAMKPLLRTESRVDWPKMLLENKIRTIRRG